MLAELDHEESILIIPRWDEGHAEFRWKPENPADVEDARQSFIAYKAKGYAAYRVDPKTGDKGEAIKEFDPKAGKIIMLPPMAGG